MLRRATAGWMWHYASTTPRLLKSPFLVRFSTKSRCSFGGSMHHTSEVTKRAKKKRQERDSNPRRRSESILWFA
jgi:alkylhydroperoxidase family enzyme